MTPEKTLELLPKKLACPEWSGGEDECEGCTGNEDCVEYKCNKLLIACANALAGKVELVKPKCIWGYDSINEFYFTVCGQDHVFTEGNILDNKHRYCPYCGGEIVEAKHSKENYGKE